MHAPLRPIDEPTLTRMIRYALATEMDRIYLRPGCRPLLEGLGPDREPNFRQLAGEDTHAVAEIVLRHARVPQALRDDASDAAFELFPLWEIPTDRLARQMISEGLRAYITCVDPKKLPARFAGREFGPSLLDELPESVDPCGENGEFHTFAVAGPMFRASVEVRVGEVVERDGFIFADLQPREAA